MTNSELNIYIKRLWKKANSYKGQSTIDWTNDDWEKMNRTLEEIKKEWVRLWNADREKTVTKMEQFKMLLEINSRHRFVSLHSITFGFKIK